MARQTMSRRPASTWWPSRRRAGERGQLGWRAAVHRRRPQERAALIGIVLLGAGLLVRRGAASPRGSIGERRIEILEHARGPAAGVGPAHVEVGHLTGAERPEEPFDRGDDRALEVDGSTRVRRDEADRLPDEQAAGAAGPQVSSPRRTAASRRWSDPRRSSGRRGSARRHRGRTRRGARRARRRRDRLASPVSADRGAEVPGGRMSSR